MGKHTTEASCATLSFDMTFFALVRILASNSEVSTRMGRCIAHPLKKRPIANDNAEIEYTSYVNAYLTYYKLLDDLRDEHGFKRIAAKIALVFAKRAVRKIPEKYSDVGKIISTHLDALSELEKKKCNMPSEVADTFGELLGKLLAFDLEGNCSKIVYEIGRSIGRWVYLADAAVDYKDDLKKGSYNPFVYALDQDDAERFFNENLDGVLSMELVNAKNAFELLDNGSNCAGCIDNIISKGMRYTLNSTLEKQKQEKKHEKSI